MKRFGRVHSFFKKYDPKWINDFLKVVRCKKTEWYKINHNRYKIIDDKYRRG